MQCGDSTRLFRTVDLVARKGSVAYRSPERVERVQTQRIAVNAKSHAHPPQEAQQDARKSGVARKASAPSPRARRASETSHLGNTPLTSVAPSGDHFVWCSRDFGTAGFAEIGEHGPRLKVWADDLIRPLVVKPGFDGSVLFVLEEWSKIPSKANISSSRSKLSFGRLRLIGPNSTYRTLFSRLSNPVAFDVWNSGDGSIVVLEINYQFKGRLQLTCLAGEYVQSAVVGPNPDLRFKQNVLLKDVSRTCVDVAILHDGRIALGHRHGLVQVWNPSAMAFDITLDSQLTSLQTGSLQVIPYASQIPTPEGLDSTQLVLSGTKTNGVGRSSSIWSFANLIRNQSGETLHVGSEIGAFSGPYSFGASYSPSRSIVFCKRLPGNRRLCLLLSEKGGISFELFSCDRLNAREEPNFLEQTRDPIRSQPEDNKEADTCSAIDCFVSISQTPKGKIKQECNVQIHSDEHTRTFSALDTTLQLPKGNVLELKQRPIEDIVTLIDPVSRAQIAMDSRRKCCFVSSSPKHIIAEIGSALVSELLRDVVFIKAELASIEHGNALMVPYQSHIDSPQEFVKLFTSVSSGHRAAWSKIHCNDNFAVTLWNIQDESLIDVSSFGNKTSEQVPTHKACPVSWKSLLEHDLSGRADVTYIAEVPMCAAPSHASMVLSKVKVASSISTHKPRPTTSQTKRKSHQLVTLIPKRPQSAFKTMLEKDSSSRRVLHVQAKEWCEKVMFLSQNKTLEDEPAPASKLLSPSAVKVAQYLFTKCGPTRGFLFADTLHKLIVQTLGMKEWFNDPMPRLPSRKLVRALHYGDFLRLFVLFCECYPKRAKQAVERAGFHPDLTPGNAKLCELMQGISRVQRFEGVSTLEFCLAGHPLWEHSRFTPKPIE